MNLLWSAMKCNVACAACMLLAQSLSRGLWHVHVTVCIGETEKLALDGLSVTSAAIFCQARLLLKDACANI